jgi:hypothetical protein
LLPAVGTGAIIGKTSFFKSPRVRTSKGSTDMAVLLGGQTIVRLAPLAGELYIVEDIPFVPKVAR